MMLRSNSVNKMEKVFFYFIISYGIFYLSLLAKLSFIERYQHIIQ